jgi:putative hydrolase of the HAD superfamily
VRAAPEARGWPMEAVRVEAARRLLLERDVTDADAPAEVERTYVTTRDASITVFGDVTPALEELCARGFELRAASNGAMDLAPLGLANYFAAVEHAPRLGVSKPDPRFYATVVERAGVTSACVLAVGDRVDNDYEPARAAGLHALLIDRAGNLDGTLPRVRALTEVPALVELVAP